MIDALDWLGSLGFSLQEEGRSGQGIHRDLENPSGMWLVCREPICPSGYPSCGYIYRCSLFFLLTKESENLLCTLGRGWERTAAGLGNHVTACTRRGLVLPSGINEQCHGDLKPKRNRADRRMRDGVNRDTSSLCELPLFPPGPGFHPNTRGSH